MDARDRHGEAGVLRLLNRHLAVAVRIDARDVTACFGGRWCALRQSKFFIHLIRVDVVERVGNDISFDSVCVLIV